MFRLLATLLFMPLLTACFSNQIHDQGSPYYQYGPATQVVLNQPLEVPGGRTRIFLQNGKPVTGVDQYVPNCVFEIRDLSQVPRSIEAESFGVNRVEYNYTQVVSSVQFRLASRLWRWNDRPSITRYIRFWLLSEQQPGVMHLTCYGSFADMHEAYPPALAEMNVALGDWGQINAAGLPR
ncbi:MAG: hypothetical protein GY696_25370 [Gammaproteobacteria bacterium]|nr:hypothetical protein [Gammaproteobacteria bacterium]